MVISDFIDEVFQGTEITQDEKMAIQGIYQISAYKLLLELVLTLKAKDQKFVKRLNDLLEEAFASLEQSDKNHLVTVFTEQNKQQLKKLVMDIQENLPADTKNKITANIDKLQTNV